jgi:glutathione synthase/RimK-type ligase-like ATP-grasp enzyme
MKAYFTYVKKTRPTGKALARELGIPFGIKTPEGPLDLLIRWGSRKPMPFANIELNNANAIHRASDKLETYNYLYQAEIPVIFMTPDYEQAWYHCQTDFVFGRSRYGHGGKDIVVYRRGEKPVQEHDFYSPYYECRNEVRIHVVRDKVVRVQRKYLDHPEKDHLGLIKNYKHGYRFRAPGYQLRPARRNDAIRAVKELGLDFGAVDMLVWGDRGHMILEVNTAPGCSPLTLRCYAGEIALQVLRETKGEIKLAPHLLEEELPEDELEDEDLEGWG